uniref:Uncharacterized protein n=1 Tax=Trichogramma kaykai TaxID=54128 RepID=A0ABD2WHH9_9HYME
MSIKPWLGHWQHLDLHLWIQPSRLTRSAERVLLSVMSFRKGSPSVHLLGFYPRSIKPTMSRLAMKVKINILFF